MEDFHFGHLLHDVLQHLAGWQFATSSIIANSAVVVLYQVSII